MTRFNPSTPALVGHVYGSVDASGTAVDATQGETAAMLAEYAPVVTSILFGGDPREKLAKKKAQLANYTRLYKGAKSKFFKGLYGNKIRTLRAEISALGEQASEERAAVALTQTGKVGVTVVLVAGAVTLLMVGNYYRQKAQTEKALRKAAAK